MHKILLVDDHDIILDGLRAMLINISDMQVIGEAKSGFEAFEKAQELLPDVIIMDISMPEMTGIEATEMIKKNHPDIKIIALTQHESDTYIMQMLNAGADGYLLKNCKKAEFLEAIQTVLNHERYFGKRVSSILLDSMLKTQKLEGNVPKKKIILTPREIEIIKYITSDLNNQEIADKLFISLRTVETHRRNIMQKLNVKSVIALVRYAVKHGIAEI